MQAPIPPLTKDQVIPYLNQLSAYFNQLQTPELQHYILQAQASEPKKLVDGLIIRADGTNWSPNNEGAGLYRYDGPTNAWMKLDMNTDGGFTFRNKIGIGNGTSFAVSMSGPDLQLRRADTGITGGGHLVGLAQGSEFWRCNFDTNSFVLSKKLQVNNNGVITGTLDVTGTVTVDDHIISGHQITIDARGKPTSSSELNFFNDYAGVGGAWDIVTLDSNGSLQIRCFSNNSASTITKTYRFYNNGEFEMPTGGAITLSGTNNKMRMNHSGDRFYMAPYDDGGYQWAREFGYDNSLNAWYCETKFYPKDNIRIKGTTTGSANSSWIGFYESNGTTRHAYVGIGSTSNNDLYLKTEVSSASIRLETKGSDNVTRTTAWFGGANGECHLYYKGGEKLKTDPNGVRIIGHAYPYSNNTYDLGASSLQYRSAYVTNYHVTPGNGYGIRFWRSDNYKIYMAADTYTGLGSPAEVNTTPDYNMYFRMTGGSNRGWVFYNDTLSTTPALQITGKGEVYCRTSLKVNNQTVYDAGNSSGVLSGTGQQKLANGFLLKWMTVTSTSDTNQSFAWPTSGYTAFTACYGAWSQGGWKGSTDAAVVPVVNYSTTSVTLNRSDSINGSRAVTIFAIGRY